MTGQNRDIARTFVELADTLVAEFDLIDFLHLITRRCQELLGVDAAGLLLTDNYGMLNVVAASGEQARLLELFQLQNSEGPCLDCFRTGRPVRCPDISTQTTRWPHFIHEASDAGFAAVYALPLRLRDDVIGGLNLFSKTRGQLDSEAIALGQALADVATIGLLHERAIRHQEVVTEQLQTALHSRLAIEQAKGIVAERAGVAVGEAFELLRSYARSHNLRLSNLAQAVVNNDLEVAEFTADFDQTHQSGTKGSRPLDLSE